MLLVVCQDRGLIIDMGYCFHVVNNNCISVPNPQDTIGKSGTYSHTQ